MEITITGKNIKITAAIRDYINKKITKVISDLEHPVNCDIILEVEKKRHITEVLLSGDTGRFYFKKNADDLYKSVDNVIHAAHLSIKKFKEKQKDHKFRNKRIIRWEKFTRKIRVKNIEVKDIKPMTVEEAVLQLKYIRQNILVFQNAKNFQTCVLFESMEGYSLIQPKRSSFFSFLFRSRKKKRYIILLLSYSNNKVSKIGRKKAEFDSISYSQAYDRVAGSRDLNYLIFENSDSGKIDIFFRINKHLIGYYEY